MNLSNAWRELDLKFAILAMFDVHCSTKVIPWYLNRSSVLCYIIKLSIYMAHGIFFQKGNDTLASASIDTYPLPTWCNFLEGFYTINFVDLSYRTQTTTDTYIYVSVIKNKN
jgi:hypothetical protein